MTKKDEGRWSKSNKGRRGTWLAAQSVEYVTLDVGVVSLRDSTSE